MKWLTMMHGPAVRKALDSGFFGSIDKDKCDPLSDPRDDAYQAIMTNAMEWLLADGVMTIKGEERRVSDIVLSRGGPLFAAEQRQWIERLATSALRLYEVVEIKPGECMTLRDVLLPGRTPVLVREKSGSRQVARFDLIAARVIPLKDHFELSGAVYLFPRNRSWELLEELRHELEGIEPDSPLAKEITSSIIPRHWLMLCVNPLEIPQVLDHVTREPILFITDHYRVQDWEALDLALSSEIDVDGTRKNGWNRILKARTAWSVPAPILMWLNRTGLKCLIARKNMQTQDGHGSKRLQARPSHFSAGRFPIPRGCSPIRKLMTVEDRELRRHYRRV